jgi:hypothetical protein
MKSIAPGVGAGVKIPAVPARWEVTMTSAAYKSAGTGGQSAERQGYGLVVFAAILLAVIGCFNVV